MKAERGAWATMFKRRCGTMQRDGYVCGGGAIGTEGRMRWKRSVVRCRLSGGVATCLLLPSHLRAGMYGATHVSLTRTMCKHTIWAVSLHETDAVRGNEALPPARTLRMSSVPVLHRTVSAHLRSNAFHQPLTTVSVGPPLVTSLDIFSFSNLTSHNFLMIQINL